MTQAASFSSFTICRKNPHVRRTRLEIKEDEECLKVGEQGVKIIYGTQSNNKNPGLKYMMDMHSLVTPGSVSACFAS